VRDPAPDPHARGFQRQLAISRIPARSVDSRKDISALNIILLLGYLLVAVVVFWPMIFFIRKIAKGQKKYWWFLAGEFVLLFGINSLLSSPIK